MSDEDKVIRLFPKPDLGPVTPDAEKPDLSVTLRPEERMALSNAGVDPTSFVGLDVPVAQIAPGSIGRGTLELQARIFVSDYLFAATDPSKRRIFLANGKVEAPSLKFGLAPTVRLVVAVDSLGDRAREEMEQSLNLQKRES